MGKNMLSYQILSLGNFLNTNFTADFVAPTGFDQQSFLRLTDFTNQKS